MLFGSVITGDNAHWIAHSWKGNDWSLFWINKWVTEQHCYSGNW